MSDLKTLILKFAYTLELNWNHLFEPLESGLREDMLEDWLQFHWELFVEYPLAANRGGEVQIRHYASGAETPSGRVFPTDKPLTHEIRFHPIDGDCLTELWDNQPIQFPGRRPALLPPQLLRPPHPDPRRPPTPQRRPATRAR